MDLFGITTPSSTRSSIQGAGHTQQSNLDYTCLVDAPLMPTLRLNAFKEYILKNTQLTFGTQT